MKRRNGGPEPQNNGVLITETDLPSFRSLPSYCLYVLHSQLERYAEELYRRRHGLKLIECRIIGITGGYKKASFQQICRDANLEKSYASRLINSLIKKGLLCKGGDQADQRTIHVTLTALGRKAHRETHASAQELNTRLTSVLTEDERASLVAMLQRLKEQVNVMKSKRSAFAESRLGGSNQNDDDAQEILTLPRHFGESLYRALGDALERSDQTRLIGDYRKRKR